MHWRQVAAQTTTLQGTVDTKVANAECVIAMQKRSTFRSGRLRNVAAVLGVFVLMTTVAACGSGTKATKAQGTQHIVITNPSPSLNFLPLYVAQEKGFYKDAGLEITIKQTDTGSTGLAALVSGSADLYMGLADTAVSAATAGSKVRLVGAITSLDDYELVVNPSIKSFADLKGKKLGISAQGSGTQLQLEYVLDKNGVDPTAVTYANVGGTSNRLAALESGQIDGTLLSTGYTLDAKAKGYKSLTKLSSYVKSANIAFMTLPSVLKQHGANIKKLLAATLKGTAWIYSHPKAATNIAAAKLETSTKSLKPEITIYLSRHQYSKDGRVPTSGVAWSIYLLKKYGHQKVTVDPKSLIDLSYLPQ